MMNENTLVILFLSFLFFGLFYQAFIWHNLRSYSSFKKRHPESFKNNKYIACPYCGGNTIYMKGKFKMNRHSHLGRQCGKKLWRSKS